MLPVVQVDGLVELLVASAAVGLDHCGAQLRVTEETIVRSAAGAAVDIDCVFAVEQILNIEVELHLDTKARQLLVHLQIGLKGPRRGGTVDRLQGYAAARIVAGQDAAQLGAALADGSVYQGKVVAAAEAQQQIGPQALEQGAALARPEAVVQVEAAAVGLVEVQGRDDGRQVGGVLDAGDAGVDRRAGAAGICQGVVEFGAQAALAAQFKSQLQASGSGKIAVVEEVVGLDVYCRRRNFLPPHLQLPFDVAIKTGEVKGSRARELVIEADLVLDGAHRFDIEGGGHGDEAAPGQLQRKSRTAGVHIAQPRHLGKAAVLSVEYRAVGNLKGKSQARAEAVEFAGRAHRVQVDGSAGRQAHRRGRIHKAETVDVEVVPAQTGDDYQILVFDFVLDIGVAQDRVARRFQTLALPAAAKFVKAVKVGLAILPHQVFQIVEIAFAGRSLCRCLEQGVQDFVDADFSIVVALVGRVQIGVGAVDGRAQGVGQHEKAPRGPALCSKTHFELVVSVLFGEAAAQADVAVLFPGVERGAFAAVGKGDGSAGAGKGKAVQIIGPGRYAQGGIGGKLTAGPGHGDAVVVDHEMLFEDGIEEGALLAIEAEADFAVHGRVEEVGGARVQQSGGALRLR